MSTQDVTSADDRSRRKKENCCVDFGRLCGVNEAQSRALFSPCEPDTSQSEAGRRFRGHTATS